MIILAKVTKAFKYIFAAILTILYLPIILIKLLIPVILGFGYLSLTIVAALLYIRLVIKVVDWLSDTDKIGALIILLAAIIFFVKMADFMLTDIHKFKTWLWKWGKKYYAKLFKDV